MGLDWELLFVGALGDTTVREIGFPAEKDIEARQTLASLACSSTRFTIYRFTTHQI